MNTRRRSRTWSACSALVLLLFLTACDDENTTETVGEPGTSTAPPSTAEPTEDVNDDPGTESEDIGDPNCFAGDWQIDESSDAWQLPAGDADDVTGTFSITFSTDGSFQMDYERWHFKEVFLSGSSGDSYVETTWDGTFSGEYVVDGNGAATVEIADSSVTLDQVQVMLGEVVEEDSGITRIDEEPIPLIYTCEDDRLIGFPVVEPDRPDPWVVYDRVTSD